MKKLIFVFLMITYLSYSQESEFMDFWKAEKVKITNERLLELLKNGESKEIIQKTNKSNEIQTSENTVVSDDALPESELHSAINPKDPNNIVVSPIRSGSGSLNDPLTCPVYFTKDGGKTWNKSTFRNTPVNSNENVLGGGDPILAFDADGKLYFTWINLAFQMKGSNPDSSLIAIYWAWSSDGGETWTRETNHTFGKDKQKYSNNSNYGLKKFFDKQWMACDISNSKYRNNLYVCHVLFDMSTNTSNIYVKTKKAKDNEFLETAILISKNKYDLAQFASIDVDKKGTIHVSFYGKTKVNGVSSSAIYYTFSTDGGESFAPEVKITSIYFSAGSNFGTSTTDIIPGISSNRAYPYPQLVVDKSNNPSTEQNIYVTYTATGISNNLKEGNNVFIVRSKDGGATWLSPRRILPLSTYFYNKFYSSTCVNPDGVLVTSFYNMGTNSLTDYVTCFSFDGGDSFLKTNASSTPTNFKTIGNKNNSFGIGEYNQTVCNKDYAFPIWSDARKGDGNLDLYFTKIPFSEAILLDVEDFVIINPLIKINKVSPNPINKLAEIDFTLDNKAEITISLFDLIGNEISILTKNTFQEGKNLISLDLSRFAIGNYFIKLSSVDRSETTKIAIER